MEMARSRWFVPAFSLALGGVMLAAFSAGGHTGLGLYSFDVMAAAGLAVIVAFLVEVARGHDGMQYAWLGAVAGLAYLTAIVVLRFRG